MSFERIHSVRRREEQKRRDAGLTQAQMTATDPAQSSGQQGIIRNEILGI